jgi:hypothetical protein
MKAGSDPGLYRFGTGFRAKLGKLTVECSISKI